MAETKKTAEQLYAQAQEAQKQLEQLQAQQPGAYESSYGAQIDALMAQLDSRPGFSYDVNGDPLYRQYAEQYQRQGKAAMEDTLGAAAGLTGGYGSSYATTAASQAYQQYLSGMQDVAPALYAAAYARYQDEGTALEKQLERLQGLESNAYGAWQAQVQANQAAQAQALDYWRYLNDAAYQAQQDEQVNFAVVFVHNTLFYRSKITLNFRPANRLLGRGVVQFRNCPDRKNPCINPLGRGFICRFRSSGIRRL